MLFLQLELCKLCAEGHHYILVGDPGLLVCLVVLLHEQGKRVGGLGSGGGSKIIIRVSDRAGGYILCISINFLRRFTRFLFLLFPPSAPFYPQQPASHIIFQYINTPALGLKYITSMPITEQVIRIFRKLNGLTNNIDDRSI